MKVLSLGLQIDPSMFAAGQSSWTRLWPVRQRRRWLSPVVVYSPQVGRGHDVAYVKIKTAVGTSAAH